MRGKLMGCLRGWLLDVYIQRDEAVLWILDEDRERVRLVDQYTPFFHIKPRNHDAEQELCTQLSGHPEVKALGI
jgi:hypothetical protein